jgi:hypothetical protein
MKGLRPGRGRLALRAGPIWLVADDILHRHVLGPGLLLHGASDVRALVEPDCAEPRGGGGGASAEQPVGEQDDAGQEKRAELDLDLGFFRLGDAQGAETLLQVKANSRAIRADVDGTPPDDRPDDVELKPVSTRRDELLDH